MKLYERNFADLRSRQRISDKFTITSNLPWARRHELFNTSNYTLFNSNKEQFAPNAPVNAPLGTTSFNPNNALIGSISIDARPWQKHRIRNGAKYRADNTSPLCTLHYIQGFNSLFASAVKVDQI